jgi:hypothetical protein
MKKGAVRCDKDAIERGMLATAELQGQLAEAHGKLANANVGQLQLAKLLDDREAEVERLRAQGQHAVCSRALADAEAEVERSHDAILALTGEVERLKLKRREQFNRWGVEIRYDDQEQMALRLERAEAEVAALLRDARCPGCVEGSLCWNHKP